MSSYFEIVCRDQYNITNYYSMRLIINMFFYMYFKIKSHI